jgi:hypothetical protein
MPGLLQAINARDRIGWLPFLEGCIAVELAGVQDAHFLWLGRRNTGKRWAASLVVKLWEVAWDLWDHRNQVKKRVETAQDIAHRDAIVLAFARNAPLAALMVFQDGTGNSSNALLSLFYQALHIAWTPDNSGSKLRAQGKTDETTELSTLPSTRPKTTHQA